MKPYYGRHLGNETQAIRLYQQNIRLAESFGSSLSVFEVALRNAIIRELERMSGRKDWYVPFKDHSRLKTLYTYIHIACSHIRARGEEVSPDKINGELTLGFWVSLFNAEFERYLWKDLRRSFPNMPKSIKKRKNVSSPLNKIRALRNRISHQESICWNLTRLTELHQTIIQVVSWLDPDLPLWLSKLDRFSCVMTQTRIQRFFSTLM